MDIEILPRLTPKKRAARNRLLSLQNLQEDMQFDRVVLVWDGDNLCATACKQDNLLKCIAVDDAYQGEGLTSTLLTALKKEAFEQGHNHLFLYTKPKNKEMFASLFFYPVAQTQDVLLMEDRRGGIDAHIDTMPRCSGSAGAVVVNCNPFTKGHRYLIETAAKQCEFLYVFVLSEDKSEFSAADRFEMVRRGTRDIKNVAVVPTGPYLISSATFPTYFLKDRDNAGDAPCLLDIEIFANRFAKKLGITRRFVGSEPLSPLTNRYNELLKEHLPKHGIEVTVLSRIEVGNTPISASEVRRLIKENDFERAQILLPATTIEYLKEKGLTAPEEEK